jgi:hypothetical protein
MTKNSAWRRAGWRSLLHKGYPRCVVRFGSEGAKLKLLTPEDEFNTNEVAQGRVPAETLMSMLTHAKAVWKELGEK